MTSTLPPYDQAQQIAWSANELREIMKSGSRAKRYADLSTQPQALRQVEAALLAVARQKHVAYQAAACGARSSSDGWVETRPDLSEHLALLDRWMVDVNDIESIEALSEGEGEAPGPDATEELEEAAAQGDLFGM